VQCPPIQHSLTHSVSQQPLVASTVLHRSASRPDTCMHANNSPARPSGRPSASPHPPPWLPLAARGCMQHALDVRSSPCTRFQFQFHSIPFHHNGDRIASRRLHGVPKLLTYFSLAIHGSVDRSRQAASKYSTVYSVYSIDDLMQVVVPSATLLALTTIKQPSLCYSHAADKANPNQSYI
jgi:hypothetical protein